MYKEFTVAVMVYDGRSWFTNVIQIDTGKQIVKIQQVSNDGGVATTLGPVPNLNTTIAARHSNLNLAPYSLRRAAVDEGIVRNSFY
ncbi:hypothetical protein HanIR_Chr07g0334761 [Helianthus annuus]|nr:hypothetical protein HanIR_Chr07g0334761 [Helianthus annuus]